MNTPESPFPGLAESLAEIATGRGTKRLRDYLEGRSLPATGGDATPADLIFQTLLDNGVDQHGLAHQLASVIDEAIPADNSTPLDTRRKHLLLNALYLAEELDQDFTLGASLDRLLHVTKSFSSSSLTSLRLPLLRALIYHQQDDRLEPEWTTILEASGETNWTPTDRTAVLTAWRGLLLIPPHSSYSARSAIDFDRVGQGLLALDQSLKDTPYAPKLLLSALGILEETFPRSPEFWADHLKGVVDQWSPILRGVAASLWPKLRTSEYEGNEAASEPERNQAQGTMVHDKNAFSGQSVPATPLNSATYFYQQNDLPARLASVDKESLEELRTEIDKQDLILLSSVAKRFSLTRKIAQIKETKGLPLHDPERERELIERRIMLGRSHGLEEGFLVQLFDLILGHSIRLERSLVLDLASPRVDGSLPRLGTLRLNDHRSEFALRNHFALGEKFTWYSTMRDLGQALQEGRVDFSIVPLLRADGLVWPEVCEELLTSPLSIIGVENVIMSEVAGADRQVSSIRFLVIARDPLPFEPGQACSTAVLFKALGGAEGLAQSIWGLKQHGVELLGFHQVPAAGRADPLFLLFLAGSVAEAPLGMAIDELRRRTELLKVLGSYPAYELGARPEKTASAASTSLAAEALRHH